MVLGRQTGFRCPQCGGASTWDVDECDACGFRSEASRGWERERRRQARKDEAHGCLWGWWDLFWIEGVWYLVVWTGRLVAVAVRAVWSIWT